MYLILRQKLDLCRFRYKLTLRGGKTRRVLKGEISPANCFKGRPCNEPQESATVYTRKAHLGGVINRNNVSFPFANSRKLTLHPAHAVRLEGTFVSLRDFLLQSALAAVGERKVPLLIAAPKL